VQPPRYEKLNTGREFESALRAGLSTGRRSGGGGAIN